MEFELLPVIVPLNGVIVGAKGVTVQAYVEPGVPVIGSGKSQSTLYGCVDPKQITCGSVVLVCATASRLTISPKISNKISLVVFMVFGV
jgi:hypothetical protein